MYVDQWIQFMTQRNQDVQVIIQEKNQSSMPVVANVNNVSVWCKAKVIFYKFAENQENLNSCSLISKFAGGLFKLCCPFETTANLHMQPFWWRTSGILPSSLWSKSHAMSIKCLLSKLKYQIDQWYIHKNREKKKINKTLIYPPMIYYFWENSIPCNMLLDFDLNNEKHLSELCHSCSNMLSQWSLVVLLCIHTQNNAHVYHVHTYESSMQFFKLPFFSQSL